MEELMQKLSGYLDAAAGVITEYAPQAVDAALAVIRIDAIFHLVVGLLLLGVGCFVMWKLVPVFKRTIGETEGMFWMFATFPLGVWIVILINCLSPVYWVSAIDPVLGLVYKAAQSAGLL